MDASKLQRCKLFSVGLPMDADVGAFRSFLDKYAPILSSVYFSVPLGRKFYSRTELETEYEGHNSEEKLLTFLALLQEYNVKSELTVNTYDLSKTDLEAVVEYLKCRKIAPDEIVCLAEYGSFLKAAFPDAEIKYSFNNTTISELQAFNTVVVGKHFLRNQAARHELLARGKQLVILLNNGCSFNCHYQCGDSKFCGAILDQVLQEQSLNQVYAEQSFFPCELQQLLETDPCAEQYRFKLSTRPLGLDFTEKVLHFYSTIQDVQPLIAISPDYYGYFCVMQQLFIRRLELDYDEIIRLKAGMPI